MKKICKKAAASLLAAAMICGTAGSMPASAAAAIAAPPDWIPTDAQGAVDFLNQHGSTYVSDGYVAFCCPVYPDADDGNARAVLQDCTADYTLMKDECLRYHCEYDFSEDHEPDYDQYPGKERYEVERAYRDWLSAHHAAFRFYVWHIESDGEFNFRLERENQNPETDTFTYSFSRSAAGVVAETDIYSWMPDCETEFKRYIEENGAISAHGNYLICAGVVNYSTGAEMNIAFSGTGEVGKFMYSGCSKVMIGDLPTGNASNVFQYAEAQKMGDLNVSMDINIPWAPEEAKEPAQTRDFYIQDNMTIRPAKQISPISSDIPEWIPQSYEEAQQFDDTYGKTRIKDGCICLCLPYDRYQDETYLLLNNFQTGKLDPNKVQAASIPPTFEETYGLKTDLDGERRYYYVYVVQPVSYGLIDLSFTMRTGGRTTAEAPVYTEIWNLTFEATETGITETDIYGWLPDCSTEFNAWIEQNGALTAHGQYLVSAGKVPVCPVEVSFQTSGKAKLEEVPVDSCAHVVEQAPGTAMNSLTVYRATNSGDLTVRRSLKYEEGYLENGKTEEQITFGYYNVDDAMMIRPLDLMNGDVSNDGMLNIADVVGMAEFLQGKTNFDQEQMIKADYNHDCRINAVDMTLMKRDIINGGGQVLRPPV